MQNILALILKGFAIGGSMLVPGVSGGAMAIILGVYDDLIHAVSSFLHDPKRYGKLLLVFGLAGLAGMLLASRPLLKLIELYRQPALYFFLGAVAGSIPMLVRQARRGRVTGLSALWVLLGMVVIFSIGLWSSYLALDESYTGHGTLTLFAAGLFGAVALVLPGISMSYVWLIFNMYDSTMRALSTFNLGYLVPLGLGLAIGTILCARFLEMAMARYPSRTYLIILGFLVASMVEVFPGLPSGIGWLLCPLLFLLGFGLILKISKLGQS